MIGGVLFGLRRWKRTEQGRRTWDRLKLRIPMKIGDVCLKIAMARFSRTLATLVGSGVDVVKALEITGNTSGNWVIEQALLEVRTKVQEGIPIAQPLLENPAFPPMVSQMIKIGEETGELEKMLGKIADFYEDEVETAINALTSIIEPLMMIGVGCMVGVIVISMYLPMFKMLKLVGNVASAPRIASARSGTRASPRCSAGSGRSPSSIPRMLIQRSFERAICHDARGQRSSAFFSFHEARCSGASSPSTAAS